MISQLTKLLLGLAALASLGAPGAASADDALPFQGVAAAVLTGAEPGEDGLHLTASATGQATHLGQFTRTENLVLYADGSFEGTLTFIAANGDELDADFVGQFTSATTAVATYTFTGGTGRFAGASGGADATIVTSDGVHFSIAFDGSIAY
jgi:hypothetical protein